MDTQSIKTSELTGPVLRYAVAVAVGYDLARRLPNSEEEAFFAFGSDAPEDHRVILLHGLDFEPDRDWSQLGSLIDRFLDSLFWFDDHWVASPVDDEHGTGIIEEYGDTPLIAACRAIAASHWGEYADIPSELVEQSDE